MRFGCDGQSIWQLYVRIAMLRCQHSWMSAVDVWLVHRSMQGSDEILPALVGHLHLLQQAFAQDNALLDEPFCPREMTLARVLLVPRFAMLQNNILLFFLIPDVHVVLLQLLYPLHVLPQISS